MTPLCITWATVPTAKPIEHIRAAAAGGFSSVGLRVLQTGATDTRLIQDAEVAEIRKAVSEEGVEILRTAGFWLDGLYSASRFKPYLALTAELGAKYITIIGMDDNRERMISDFADMTDRCAEFGLLPTIEPTPFSALKTLQEGSDLLVRSGKPGATLIPDSLHLQRSGGTADDLARVPPSQIAIAHLCDATLKAPSESSAGLLEEARSNRFDLGKGELPLMAYLRAVPKHALLEIEVPCKAEKDLPPVERAKNAGAAARAFLKRFEEESRA